jgi:glycosyltransferase involved in cell wall biosynthesis
MQTTEAPLCDVSVVIPLLNEEESLPELTDRIVETLVRAGYSFEILYVDDGSSDRSFEVLKEQHARHAAVRVIRMKKNYGKSAALAEGFRAATGRYVATMDADLQDDPNELPSLIRKLDEGYDLVSGWKKKRHDPISKTVPSRFFNFVTSLLTGIRLHDFNCGLKAYRRQVVRDVNLYGELHRYIPVLARWEGYSRITELPVQHHPRKYGYSKFGVARFIRGFLDLLTVLFLSRYLRRPLHFFGFVGTAFFLTGLGICLYLTIDWFLGTPIGNRPILFLGVLLILVGIQIVSTGLVGEMLTYHFHRQKEYPVRERLG